MKRLDATTPVRPLRSLPGVTPIDGDTARSRNFLLTCATGGRIITTMSTEKRPNMATTRQLTEVLRILLSVEDRALLDRLAFDLDRSRSGLLRWLLRRASADLPLPSTKMTPPTVV